MPEHTPYDELMMHHDVLETHDEVLNILFSRISELEVTNAKHNNQIEHLNHRINDLHTIVAFLKHEVEKHNLKMSKLIDDWK